MVSGWWEAHLFCFRSRNRLSAPQRPRRWSPPQIYLPHISPSRSPNGPESRPQICPSHASAGRPLRGLSRTAIGRNLRLVTGTKCLHVRSDRGLFFLLWILAQETERTAAVRHLSFPYCNWRSDGTHPGLTWTGRSSAWRKYLRLGLRNTRQLSCCRKYARATQSRGYVRPRSTRASTTSSTSKQPLRLRK